MSRQPVDSHLRVWSPKNKNFRVLNLAKIPRNTEILILTGCKKLTSFSNKQLFFFKRDFPLNLEEINFTNCSRLAELPPLTRCRRLKKLDLSDTQITRIADLSPSITELDISGNQLLESIDFGSYPNLTKLSLKNFANLKRLENLPANITELSLIGCTTFEILDLAACTKLAKLNLSNCSELILRNIPTSITELDITVSQLETLNLASHRNLKKLSISGHVNLRTIEIPPDIEEVFITHCPSIDLTACTNLTKLALPFCSDSAALKAIPASVIELNLRGYNQETIDISACTKLTTFILSHSSSLKKLENLPASVIDLDISLCESLEVIDLAGCRRLKKLNLCGCGIRNIKSLPGNIAYLNLSGCKNLPNTPETIATLTSLEQANRHNPNFKLVWPDHLNRNANVTQIKDDLKAAYKKYWEENRTKFKDFFKEGKLTKEPSIKDEASCPTLALVHRFMSESVALRGGIDDLVTSMRYVVDEIRANPSFLEITDEAAKGRLAACINQPVQGFIEISFIASVAKAKTIHEKLENARKLLVLDAVNNMVNTLKNSDGQKIGSGIEVELANALIMEVNKGFPNPWPGVPTQIAYQANVQSFLTTKNISKVAKEVSKILSMELQQVAEKICEGRHQDSWADSVLSKEELAVIPSAQKLKELKNHFMEMDGSEENYLATHRAISRTEANLRKEKLILSREKTLENLGLVPVEAPRSSLQSDQQKINRLVPGSKVKESVI